MDDIYYDAKNFNGFGVNSSIRHDMCISLSMRVGKISGVRITGVGLR